jgi:Xaa-Pro aminopeptidase
VSTATRIAKLVSSCEARYLLCLRYEDIRWLSGFTGSTAQLLIDRQLGEGHLFVDGRYLDRALTEVQQVGAAVSVHLVQSAQSTEQLFASIVGVDSVEVDDAHLTAAHFTRLQSAVSVRVAPSPLDNLRRVKDEFEISLIARAAEIADNAIGTLLDDGLIGRTEREIRNRLDALMRTGGADTVGFDTIVATGVNGAMPHHEPSDAAVEDGHMVVIDFGAEVQGYRSDMTRTIQVGNVSDELLKMFDIVREAQEASLATVKAGVVGSVVDSAVREVYAREGVEHEYVHGTGHGIGLFIHEPPIFSPRCEAVLGVNEVVTVEPGLYRKGVGGARIEDLVVVRDNNCRILSHTPKDLICPRSPRTI